ncbi:hypothetical protein J2TS6_48830 [Paenibacillus albilobatus]|uniref:Uncharacterized protein n=1 Tax=Paenibacillus albilobatus TaxID=2716884 RepID=A0A919XN67_9BACL|nr:hypothetical protein [Paenibacillus albilobatus]GIO33742.1 hypothetical protein J2TS6_48830 [Paenibacillus albilobatus]
MVSKKNPEQATEQEQPAKQEKQAAAPAARQQLIYIGPTIRENGIGLRTNQTFIGGHPAFLQPLYEKYPQIKVLFVPVEKLREAQKQIQQTGTALNTAALSLKGVQ